MLHSPTFGAGMLKSPFQHLQKGRVPCNSYLLTQVCEAAGTPPRHSPRCCQPHSRATGPGQASLTPASHLLPACAVAA